MINEFKQHLIKALKEGLRADERKHDAYREIIVEHGISKNAEGSARVKIGDTEVLAGVKLELSEPYPDRPDEGSIMVNAELTPLANPEWELGPPGIDAIELSRVVDRGIRESGAIDLKKLCIKKGEKCWIIIVDIVPINDAGNLFDASALAAVAALLDARFPKYENEEVDYKAKTDEKMPINSLPISVTVIKIGSYYLVDPVPEEEAVLDARLTVAVRDDGQLCALQKGGDEPLTAEDVDKMTSLAIEKSKELRNYLS